MNLSTIGAVLVNCVRSSRPSWLGGDREPEDIAADPRASEQELFELADEWGDTGQIAAVMHPNCPPDLFFTLTKLWPIEARDNPSFKLIVAFEPLRWRELVVENASAWIRTALEAHPQIMDRFMVWCLSRALSVIEPYTKLKSSKRVLANIQKVIEVLQRGKDDNKARDAFDSVRGEDDPLDNAEEPGSAITRLELAAYYAMHSFLDGQDSYESASEAASSSGAAMAYAEGWRYAVQQGLEFRFFQEEEGVDGVIRHADETETAAQWEHILYLLKYQDVFELVKDSYKARFREAYYGPEAKREKAVQLQINKAVKQMQTNTKAIVNIMNRVEEGGLAWPDYLAIGLVVGGVVLVVLAPELFIVSGVAEASGMFAFRATAAATIVADEIALLSARAAVSTVTIEFNKAVALTAAQSIFVKELATKLAQSNVTVDLAKTVEAVVKVTR